jgi:hypothetical protein
MFGDFCLDLWLATSWLCVSVGKALERLLPNATISLTRRWSFRLNPGPFTLKEHLLIGVLASGASGSSYAGDIVAVQDLYYHVSTQIFSPSQTC